MVTQAIQEVILELKHENLPVVRTHSDRAHELRSPGLREWALGQQIMLTRTEGQSPQSNGTAERAVRFLKGQGALDVASFRIVAKALDPKNPWPADEGWDNTWVEASADSNPQNPWPATGEGLPAARQQRIAVRDVKGRWYGFMTDQCNSTAELRGYGRS